MPIDRGVLLYGPPAAGLDTISTALAAIDSRFVQFPRLKAGGGQSAGYRMVDLEEFARADETGELLHSYSRYDALYGIERAELARFTAEQLVPVVHVGQVEALDAVLADGLPTNWTVVCLWCSREEAERRLTARGATDVEERLKVWDETLGERQVADPGLFDLSITTAASTVPESVAELIAAAVNLDPAPNPSFAVVARRARQLFGPPRFIGYLQHCRGDQYAALELYEWNNAVSAAMWESLGHLEVALRNALSARMGDRHRRLRRARSWLDDPLGELDWNARDDISKARNRVVRKSKPPSDGQTIAELSLGFWRYLLAKRYTTNLWPDLAGAFPNAPDRARTTVEDPVIRLHGFRNRIAHHERIWTEPIRERYADTLQVLGYIDQDLSNWVSSTSRVPELLASCPQPLPHP